jgi:predicted nucleotidyltransferase component of viral defense system
VAPLYLACASASSSSGSSHACTPSAAGEWILKGGFALELRLGDPARTTKDIDIDWAVGESDAVELLLAAAALDLDDRFEFSLERVRAADDAQRGQRWAITAVLAGREFERVAIDLEFATRPVLEPNTIVGSDLLDFAGIDPVPVPTVAIEQHVAEKLHAYTRRYAGDAPSSRVKDLVDLVVIPGHRSSTAPRCSRQS